MEGLHVGIEGHNETFWTHEPSKQRNSVKAQVDVEVVGYSGNEGLVMVPEEEVICCWSGGM